MQVFRTSSRTILRLMGTLLAAILLLVIPPVQALTQSDLDAINGQYPWYDPNDTTGQCGLSSSTATTDASSSSDSSTDINSIVQKYGLQSAIILSMGSGNTVASYHADQPPNTPASTMKLIIADVALREKLDLSRNVSVGSDVYYGGNNDLGASKTTLSNALDAMLSRSSNTAANVLMKAMGGPSTFTSKANNDGYPHTSVKGYYDPSNDGKNSSTISDEANAMQHIFSSNGSGYNVAQSALESAAKNDNHYNVSDDANKWAGTTSPPVAGNVAKLKAGSKDYIIGVYINKATGDPDAAKAISQGTADLAQLAASQDTSSSTSSGSGSGSGNVNSLYILGDSITARVDQTYNDYKPAFQQYSVDYGKSFIDGSVSRALDEPGQSPATTGFQALTNDDTGKISKADAIVIELGTNGGDTAGNIDQAVNDIRQNNKNAPIYWVDTFSNASSEVSQMNAANDAIYSRANKDNYTVISWAKTVNTGADPQHLTANTKDPNNYIDTSDGMNVHPTQAGAKAMAELVLKTVTDNATGPSNSQANGSSCCVGSTTTLDGKGNGDKVFNYFIGKGLSVPQVAGIMGNFQIESGFIPTKEYGGAIVLDPSHETVAWGLAQWLPGSKIIGLQKQAGVGGNIDDLATQLDIVWWEMNNQSPTGAQDMIAGLKQINDPAQAATYWQNNFEGAQGQASQDRVNAANEWANHPVDSSASATDTSESSGCGGGSVSPSAAGIVQEAIKLSWPDNSHGTTPTSAYAQAYAQYNPNGPGIADCGGFVATVMHATGADPNYPAGGTGAQAAYVKAHPDKYDVVDKVTNLSDLQPGDIMIVNAGSGTGVDGHTYIYVGPQSPHNYNEASASLNERAPSLGMAVLSDYRGNYMRVRLK